MERILEATKTVLAEQGNSNLKVSQVAAVAGVSVSSIYQYFPNKSAILAALCDQYLEANRETVKEAFAEKPETVHDLIEVTSQLFDAYYTYMREDPVIRDVWSGVRSDKSIQQVDADDTQINVDLMYERSQHLFREGVHGEAKLKFLLIVSWGGAAVNIAINKPENEGKIVIEKAKALLRACWREEVFPLVRPEALKVHVVE